MSWGLRWFTCHVWGKLSDELLDNYGRTVGTGRITDVFAMWRELEGEPKGARERPFAMKLRPAQAPAGSGRVSLYTIAFVLQRRVVQTNKLPV